MKVYALFGSHENTMAFSRYDRMVIGDLDELIGIYSKKKDARSKGQELVENLEYDSFFLVEKEVE